MTEEFAASFASVMQVCFSAPSCWCSRRREAASVAAWRSLPKASRGVSVGPIYRHTGHLSSCSQSGRGFSLQPTSVLALPQEGAWNDSTRVRNPSS
jgi:hypothetical protein